jgi:hypothetical protein
LNLLIEGALYHAARSFGPRICVDKRGLKQYSNRELKQELRVDLNWGMVVLFDNPLSDPRLSAFIRGIISLPIQLGHRQ